MRGKSPSLLESQRYSVSHICFYVSVSLIRAASAFHHSPCSVMSSVVHAPFSGHRDVFAAVLPQVLNGYPLRASEEREGGEI